jgi:hypothetical protein
MATLYNWIVLDMAAKIKKDPMPEVQRCADNYQRNLGIDAKKLIEEAQKINAKAA